MSWLETQEPPSSLAGLILALETIKIDPDSFNDQSTKQDTLNCFGNLLFAKNYLIS